MVAVSRLRQDYGYWQPDEGQAIPPLLTLNLSVSRILALAPLGLLCHSLCSSLKRTQKVSRMRKSAGKIFLSLLLFTFFSIAVEARAKPQSLSPVPFGDRRETLIFVAGFN
jgi:hypothetical protein